MDKQGILKRADLSGILLLKQNMKWVGFKICLRVEEGTRTLRASLWVAMAEGNGKAINPKLVVTQSFIFWRA